MSTIALVAHDSKKQDMVEWANYNKEKPYGYIYKTTCLFNNKIYIGQKKNLFDKKYYGSGIALTAAIKKYGKENFIVELIEYCYCKFDLDKQEKFWIKTLDAFSPNGYNIAEGGSFGNVIAGMTENQYKLFCEAISKNHKDVSGKNNPNYGKNLKQTLKNKYGKNWKKKYKEFCEKISKSNSGKNNGRYYELNKELKEKIFSLYIKEKRSISYIQKNLFLTRRKIKQCLLEYDSTLEFKNNIKGGYNVL